MAITRVQGNDAVTGSSSTTLAVTLSTGVTQGNLLVANVHYGNNNLSITAPDGSWNLAVSNVPAGASSPPTVALYYLVVDAAHAGGTSWTWTMSASVNFAVEIEEWHATNGWPANPLDKTAQGDTSGTPTTATTILSGTTATTTQAEELWIAALAYKGAAQTESSITSGWTKDLEETKGTNFTGTLLYNVASATGAAACQYTIGSAQFWAGCVATFKDTAGTLVDHDLTWRGITAKTINHDLTWRGLLSNTIDHDLTWRGLTGHVADHDLTWRGLISQTSDRDLTWRGITAKILAHDLSWRGLTGHTVSHDVSWRGNIAGAAATFYASNVASTIGGLTQSDQMSQTVGGVETSFTVTAPSSGTNSYLELVSQGGTPGTTASLPAPTGKGWSISLAGQTITAGSWHAAFTLAKSGTTMSGAQIIVRFFRRTIDGHYYPIGMNILSAQTFSTVKTIYTLGSVNATLWQFIAGDTLYMDAFAFNGATAWASDVFTIYVSNSATQGVSNDGTITCPSPIATPAGLNCLVGSSSFVTDTSLPVKNESFTLADALDQRSILTLTLEDAPGTGLYVRGNPVMFSDYNQGLLYTGFTNSDKLAKLAAGGAAQLEHQMTFMDNHYLYDKRANTTDYLNWTAGDIACDFVQQTLSQEGVSGAFALESDYTPTTFGQGTLTNTVATTTTSPFIYAPNTATPPITTNTGDLEIVAAGSALTITEQTTSDFGSGTLTNMQATNNSLVPTTQSALRVQAELPLPIGQAGSDLAQVQIWSGSMAVGSTDTLNYDIWISSTSPAFVAAVDLGFSDGSLLSGLALPNSVFDQNFLLCGPTIPPSPPIPGGVVDLATYAKDAWYTRTIALGAVSGKTITAVYVSLAGASAGLYTIFVKNCYLGSQAGSPFFATNASAPQLNPPVVTQALGYTSSLIATTVVQVYNPSTSSRISPAHSIDVVKLVRSSTIVWTASLPTVGTQGMPNPTTGTTPSAPTALISVSYDGTTWLPATNNTALPGLPAGATVAGLSLYLRETFSGGSDPTAIPALLVVTITMQSAASATTTDVTAAYGNAAAWNSGTFTNTQVNAAGRLVLGSVSRNWSNHSTVGQTLFASSGTTQSAASGSYVITVPNSSGGAVHASDRFDFAGLCADFQLDIDVTIGSVPNGPGQIGILYRSTDWETADNTFGYSLVLNFNNTLPLYYMELGRGSNTDVGSYTAIKNVSLSLSTGTTYHLTVIVRGNQHSVFLNHAATPTIEVIDATFSTPGYVGVRAYANGSASTIAMTYANFSVTPVASGSWLSPSLSLSALGTTGNSSIDWTTLQPNGTASQNAFVQTSLDGGSTWQTCTSGKPIPQLPKGTNVSGKSLLVQVLLFGPSIVTSPIIWGLSVRVCGPYGTVTGTRISPALSLTPVGYVAASNCMWNANVPTNTTVVVATSQDQVTWTNVPNSGAGAALSYWTNQPAATQDLFSSNTSANYTNTFKTGGSAASAIYDTTNSRITLSGGSGGLYLNSSISTSDVDIVVDMDESDAGGIVWREVDTNDYYELGVYDASSSGGFTNQLRLYKVSAGTRTLLGSASTITFTRGTFHRVRAKMEGNLIDIYFDGTCVQSILDLSALGAGACGLRNDGGTSRYYQLWIQPLGTNLSGQVLYTRVTMTTTDPSMMPQLFTLVACVRGSSIATGATIAQLHPITTPFAQYFAQEMDALVQASGDYYWYVDRWKKARFGPRLARPGAFPLQSVDDPAKSSGFLLYQTPQGVSVTSAMDLFRNQQIVTDVTNLATPPAEIKVADGSTTSWTMGYPLYSAPTILVYGQALATVPTLANLINGQPATVGVQGIDNNRQFYWQPGSPSISYDSTLPKLPAGVILSFTYVGETTVNNIQNNSASQTAQAAIESGTTGIIAEIESALNSATKGMTTAQATAFANGLLSRYGNNNAVELIGATPYSGLEPGTVISLFLPEIMNIWNRQLPIIKLTTQGFQKGDGTIGYLYIVDATDGANLSRWSAVWF